MIFPDRDRERCRRCRRSGWSCPGTCPSHTSQRVTARPSVSPCLFFFFLFCFTSASRAEPFKWYHPWFLFFLSQTSLLCRAPELSSISSKLREALVRWGLPEFPGRVGGGGGGGMLLFLQCRKFGHCWCVLDSNSSTGLFFLERV